MLEIRNRFVSALAERRYEDSVDILKSHPTIVIYDKNLDNKSYQTSLHWLLSPPDLKSAPLWVVQILVENGADVNRPCCIGFRPLRVLDGNWLNATPDVIHYLLDEGALGGDDKIIVQDVKKARKRCREANITMAWALKQQGVPKDLVNQICEEFWELRTK